MDRDPDTDQHPIATLKMKLVDEFIQGPPARNSSGHRGALESQVSARGSNLKRKRSYDMGIRGSKRLKLNIN